MTSKRDLQSVMRSGMAAEAGRAVTSGDLAERIIAVAMSPELAPEPAPSSGVPIGRRLASGWRPWVLPVVAALGIAILIASAVIATQLIRSNGVQPASTASVVPAPGPVISSPNPAPTSVAPHSSGSVPAGFRVVDLTWVSVDEGWALGTAPCSKAPCTSIVHTTDGGQSWVGIHAPSAELTQGNCQQQCISSLRFANDSVGYAFGPEALFMTVDGGRTWQRESGGAYWLEAANGSVLRVITQCLPGCPFSIQRSNVGSATWTTITLPPGAQVSGAQLVRGGHSAVLATFGHVAGGATNQTSVLFTSADDGTTWTKRGEPCPQTGSSLAGSEVDASNVTIAADGSITVLCSPRGGADPQFTMTSTDGGAHFVAAPRNPGAGYGKALGAASASVLLVSTDTLYRSTDGGQVWRKVQQNGAGPGQVSFIGFESAMVGRAIESPANNEVGSATIWTTTDAGAHWTAHTFH
jgi:hypothetical protein